MKRKIILFLAIAVFLFSAYKLFEIFREYRVGEKEYNEIEAEVVVEVSPSEQGKVEEEKVTEGTGEQFRINFQKLIKINKETVAWIRFDNPKKINYPIVQTSDNRTYLTKTISGQKNANGTIFMDMINAKDFSDRNTFIYGHNMKNGEMFGELDKYKSEKFCKENPYFYIYTPDGQVRTYQVFAVAVVESNSESYNMNYANDEKYMSYIEMIRDGALYQTDVPVQKHDTIVSLSTCTNVEETGRLIVHGVLIGTESVE